MREERQFLSGASELAPEEMVELCWIGIPSEPRDFVTRAIAAGHPRSLDVHVDETMQKVVKLNLIDPPFVLAKKRVEYLKKWTARAKETVAQEEELRNSMPDHVRQVLGQKRLFLFAEMLKDLDYPDDKLIDDIAAGFRLSGYMTRSNVFRAGPSDPPCQWKLYGSWGGRSMQTASNHSVGGRSRSLKRPLGKRLKQSLRRAGSFLTRKCLLTASFWGAALASSRGPKSESLTTALAVGST